MFELAIKRARLGLAVLGFPMAGFFLLAALGPGVAVAQGDWDLEIGEFNHSCSKTTMDDGKYTYTLVTDCSVYGDVYFSGDSDYHYSGTLTCRAEVDGTNPLSGHEGRDSDGFEAHVEFDGSDSQSVRFEYEDLYFGSWSYDIDCSADLTGKSNLQPLTVADVMGDADFYSDDAEDYDEYEDAWDGEIDPDYNEFSDPEGRFDRDRKDYDPANDLLSEYSEEDASAIRWELENAGKTDGSDMNAPSVGDWTRGDMEIITTTQFEQGTWQRGCREEYFFFETCDYMVYRGYLRLPEDLAALVGMRPEALYPVSFWMGWLNEGEGPFTITLNMEAMGGEIPDSSFSLGHTPTVNIYFATIGSMHMATAYCDEFFGPDANFPKGGISCKFVQFEFGDMEALARQISGTIHYPAYGLAMKMSSTNPASGISTRDYMYLPAEGFDEVFEATIADRLPE